MLVSNCSAVVDLWQNEECIYVSVERKSHSFIQKEIFCLKSGFGRWGQVYGFVNGKSDKIGQPERGKAGAAPCTSSSIEMEHTFPASTCTQSTCIHHMDMGLATQTYLHNRVRCVAGPDKFTQQDTTCTQLALFISLFLFSHSSFSPNHCYPSFFQLFICPKHHIVSPVQSCTSISLHTLKFEMTIWKRNLKHSTLSKSCWKLLVYKIFSKLNIRTGEIYQTNTFM